jgi:N-acetyl-1-D-myo-inositol-2-amino-2-deoxy-alpha-D-glucopyranoside deacetylase
VNTSLLAVFAHPDDEVFSGGTLAHYASLGVRVTLVCATRGDAGKVSDPELQIDGPEALAELRKGELERSAALLGVAEVVTLGYGDSGREERTRTGDSKALMNADPVEVEAKLREVIAEVRPQVIVTFDPHGGYGHADHLAVHRATSAAFFSTGHLEGAPQRLFFGVTTTETARVFGAESGLDPLLYGVSDSTVTLTLDVRAQLQTKLAALAAHRSQMGPSSRMAQLTGKARAELDGFFEREAFALGGVRGPLALPLRGLFDGLGLPVV